MKKYLLIVPVAFLIFLVFAYAVWWNLSIWLNQENKTQVKNGQNVSTENKETVKTDNGLKVVFTDNSDGTKNVYGVKMQSQCFDKLQDFVKTYGSDYTKCLADFNFNEQYCGGFDPNTEGLSDINIIVILDSSGSMAGQVGSQTKISVAKKAVSEFLAGMPQGVKTGLVVYGHKGSNFASDKDLSCSSIEEVVKLGANNSSKIISAMNSFSPKGWTPIAGSLDFARDIFSSKAKTNKNYLILVSDGVESCDGDPLVAAGELKAKIPGIKLNVIGFATDRETHDFLGKIALRGGGTYLTADNSSDMSNAFNKELLLIKKDCLSTTFLQMSVRYNANYASTLDCWLASHEKESNSFKNDIPHRSIDNTCNQEIADVLGAREKYFWYKKEALNEKNSQIYNTLKADLNNQLKILGK